MPPLRRLALPIPFHRPTSPRPTLHLVAAGDGPTDRFGFRHAARAPSAVAAFETAVHAIAAHRPQAAEALGAALREAPDFAAAHALQGFAQVMLARAECAEPARRSCEAARAALAATGGGADEHALVEALARAVEGRLGESAQRLDEAAQRNPRAFVLVKLAHALRFMVGDAAGMLELTRRALDANDDTAEGYGFLLGCHAFSLEEHGRYGEAEAAGRRAVALRPDDAWGMHAVSHVHEMQGRTAEGVRWLEATRPAWTRCNNFSFHMAWHLTLFHLEMRDHDRVLDLYDREVRPRPSDDFRDVANAVSLLWRLRQDGVAVGGRWAELAASANRRKADTTLTFATLHHLLALIAAGEREAALELRANMGRRAGGAGDQARVMADVGGDLADALLGLDAGGARVDLADLAARLRRIGGSHAQRDVFVQSLARLAADRRDTQALARILAARQRAKREDRFARSFDTCSTLAA